MAFELFFIRLFNVFENAYSMFCVYNRKCEMCALTGWLLEVSISSNCPNFLMVSCSWSSAQYCLGSKFACNESYQNLMLKFVYLPVQYVSVIERFGKVGLRSKLIVKPGGLLNLSRVFTELIVNCYVF